MRFYFLGGLLLVSSFGLHAAPATIDTSALGEDGGASAGVGVTVSVATRPYEDADDAVAFLPYFSFGVGDFYISGLNLGYQLTEDPDEFAAPEVELRWDIIAVPRFLGFKAEESDVLLGLEDTDYSIHAGISASLINGPVNFNAQVLTDILGVSGGTEVITTVSKAFSFDKLSLTPAFNLSWQDSNLVDHYFGISAADATAERAAYNGDSVVNVGASLTAAYPFTGSLLGIGAVTVDQFGSGITDSPIATDDAVTTATFGLVYSF
jgi:outer membrane scaffolding protein for murein synthesis (MipA/OmpV family)